MLCLLDMNSSHALDSKITLIQGSNAFLLQREIKKYITTFTAHHADGQVHRALGSQLEQAELANLLSPSLFAETSLVTIENADTFSPAVFELFEKLVNELPEEFYVLLTVPVSQKKIITHLRRLADRTIELPNVKTMRERIDFVRTEFNEHQMNVSSEVTAYLIDVVGHDLPDLIAAVNQLSTDADITGEKISRTIINQYFQGRPEVTGFDIADQVILGDEQAALEGLRWALFHGTSLILIADAVAEAVNTLARYKAVGPQDASQLGLPPWKLKKFATPARKWTKHAINEAVQLVAQLNRDVKGMHVNPELSMEHTIRKITQLSHYT